MRWRKLGLVDVHSQETSHLTHAMVPLARYVADALFDIYYTMRDSVGRGRVYVSRVDIVRNKVVSAQRLALGLGEIGAFDDNGVTAGSFVCCERGSFLFYSGINVRNTIPFSSNSGMAVVDDFGLIDRKYFGPVLDRNFIEPHFSAMPFVLYENGIFRAWYLSGVRWEVFGSGLRHYYHIKYAESFDGLRWNQTGKVAIDFKGGDEYAIARPCVVKEKNGSYSMWYCYRAQGSVETYRIGYAVSSDGLTWDRRDHLAGIDVSREGWDSEMICYPYVFDHRESRYMLYNGNAYGKSGFGLAILEENK